MHFDPNRSIDVKVSEIEDCGRDIRAYTLRPLATEPLPSADAGSHIDVMLPNGLVRQYSLILGERPTTGYRIAVKRDAVSRGGSAYIHSEFCLGMTLKIKPPRNHFPLDENAPHSVLIAGGIGITPIFSMAHRLLKLSRSWELYYACRSRFDLAFAEEMPQGSNVHLHLDDESRGQYLDLEQIVANAPLETHFYCCGPLPLMAMFEKASSGISDSRKHVEYFTAKETHAPQGGFRVKLARSDRVLEIPEGGSILDALKAAGVSVEHSCTEGICGTCETKVLAGIPDHRDSVLTAAERAANNTIIVCCSGSKTDELVLDL
jgi:ferredoxin-NADP reductase